MNNLLLILSNENRISLYNVLVQKESMSVDWKKRLEKKTIKKHPTATSEEKECAHNWKCCAVSEVFKIPENIDVDDIPKYIDTKYGGNITILGCKFYHGVRDGNLKEARRIYKLLKKTYKEFE